MSCTDRSGPVFPRSSARDSLYWKIMQELSVFWLRAAVALYAIGLFQTIQTVLHRRAQMYGAVLVSFGVAVVLHGVSLVETAWIQGQFPVNNFYESMALCGFVVAV